MPSAVASESVKAPVDASRRILIVDDDRDFADALCEHLAIEGYEARAAYDGRQAKELMMSQEPQVAFLDLHLRGEDGLELMSQVISLRPDLLCVVVTAYPRVESAVEALRNGAYDYLLKPLKIEQLLATLEHCFEKIRLEREKRAAEEALRKAKDELELRNSELKDLIAKHIRTEDALRESERNFSAVLDNSPSGISLRDSDGNFLLVNKQMERWAGIPAGDLIGKCLLRIYPSSTATELEARDREVLESGRIVEFELDVPFADGKSHTVAVTEFPVSGDDGKMIGVGAIKTDVSDQRRAEEQLRQAQKMEAIGQLTGGIAHDFNNLLTVILGNVQFLRDHVAGDPQALSYVETALKATHRGTDLTQRLQAFSRQQPLDPTLVDPKELVSDIGVMLKRTLGEEIEIRTRLVDDTWPALVDPNQLQNALLNLAVNARDAMPGGGTLTIETANLHAGRDQAASQDGPPPGDYVMLAVSDFGVGMTPDVKARAFDPFFTTKKVGQGSGLGLSMVYGFIKQSGGHLRLDTEPGEGTTVMIYLPRAEGTEKAAAILREPKGMPRGGGETILVVEDDPDVRALVVTSLEKLGYDILQAEHGPAAILQCEHAKKIDLLLTDVVLPRGMNGREIAEVVRRRFPEVKCLFTSGYPEKAIGQGGHLDPGVDLLSKPYRRAALADKVRTILDRPQS